MFGVVAVLAKPNYLVGMVVVGVVGLSVFGGIIRPRVKAARRGGNAGSFEAPRCGWLDFYP